MAGGGSVRAVDLVVQRIQPDEGDVLRALRLAALTDAPTAFASTLASETDRPPEAWAARARSTSAGDDAATFLARLDGRVVGLAGGVREPLRAPTAELVSMWTAPDARGAGVARALVDAVLRWAEEAGIATVGLWVTRGNDAALALYRAAGFVTTGDHQPSPTDPCRDEVRMVREAPGGDGRSAQG